MAYPVIQTGRNSLTDEEAYKLYDHILHASYILKFKTTK